MFGLDGTVLAFVLLAGLSAGGLAYAFLFSQLENEKKAGRRLETVKNASTDRVAVKVRATAWRRRPSGASRSRTR